MDETLELLIADLAPTLAAAFMAAIRAMRSRIDYEALVDALRAGNIDAAIDALNIGPSGFNSYIMERQSGFVQAGELVSEKLTTDRIAYFRRPDRNPSIVSPPLPPEPSGPGRSPPPLPPTLSIDGPVPTNIIFSFEMQNPRAEARIRTEAATRIAGYVDEQIETARRVISEGFARGEGPQTIATDIAGRINPISKRREGGIVGLSDPQTIYVDSMRARLLSGDPDEMMKVLGRFDKDGKWVEGTGMTLRDRRYDGAVKRAIAAIAKGKSNPLTREKINELTAKYSDRLLARRAEDIARTETASGVEMARAEATKQALEKAGLPDNAVTKGWVHQGGLRHAREPHLAMHGKTVQGIDTPFHLPDGSVMQFPHDPAGGVKNNANCRCRGDQDIEWAFGL